MSAPETKDLIGGIDATAPIWNKTEPSELHAIVAALSDASYHYAVDSADKCGDAAKAIRHAAMAVNAARLDYYAITCLHRHKAQLVTLEQFMDAILRDARPALHDVRVVTVEQLQRWGDHFQSFTRSGKEIRTIIGGQP